MIEHILTVFSETFSFPLVLLIIFFLLMLFETKEKGPCEYTYMKKWFFYWLALTAAYLFYEIMHP